VAVLHHRELACAVHFRLFYLLSALHDTRLRWVCGAVRVIFIQCSSVRTRFSVFFWFFLRYLNVLVAQRLRSSSTPFTRSSYAAVWRWCWAVWASSPASTLCRPFTPICRALTERKRMQQAELASCPPLASAVILRGAGRVKRYH
jgi:hypothetical protein